VGLGVTGSGVTVSVGQRGVGRVARGRSGELTWGRSVGRAGVGRAGRVDVCGVGRLGARGSIGQLDHWVQVMYLLSITLDDE
jgi:hypothetical protein